MPTARMTVRAARRARDVWRRRVRPTEARVRPAAGRVAALRDRFARGTTRVTIGATAFVVGTTAVVVALAGSAQAPIPRAGAPLPPPRLPAGIDAWTSAAQADLAAIRFQSAEAARGVGAWGSVPRQGRTQVVVTDYAQLRAVEDDLAQRQDLLSGELATVDRDRIAAATLTSALARYATTRGASHAECVRLEGDFAAVNGEVRTFIGRPLPSPGDLGPTNLADVIVRASMASGPGPAAGAGNAPHKATPATPTQVWQAEMNQVAPFIKQILGH